MAELNLTNEKLFNEIGLTENFQELADEKVKVIIYVKIVTNNHYYILHFSLKSKGIHPFISIIFLLKKAIIKIVICENLKADLFKPAYFNSKPLIGRQIKNYLSNKETMHIEIV